MRTQCIKTILTLFYKVKVKVKSLSRVRLFATPWTVAYQAPPSMGFSWQEYWSGLPFPSPGDLSNPGIEPGFPTFQAHTLTSESPGKPDNSIEMTILSQQGCPIKDYNPYEVTLHRPPFFHYYHLPQGSVLSYCINTAEVLRFKILPTSKSLKSVL